MNHSDVYALIESYVFGTLEDDEAHAVDQHLDSGCSECLKRLREVSEVSVQLARSLPQMEPSQRVRDQLFQKIRSGQDAQVAPRTVTTSPKASARWAWGSATAAAIAAMILLVWSLGLSRDVATLRTTLGDSELEVAQLRQQVASVDGLRQEIDQLKADLVTYQDVTHLLSKPCTQFLDLTGVDPNPQAFGKVVFHPGDGDAVIHMYRLPPSPEGMEYQMWVMREGKPTSAGLFKVSNDGTAVIKLDTLDEADAIAAFNVTIEPEGGQPQPTGMMYLTSPNVLNSPK